MNSKHVEVLRELLAKWREDAAAYVVQASEKDKSGGFRWAGWMRDELRSKAGVCKRHADELESAIASLSAPAEAQRCTCPSGDGSLRWPCPVHPPEAQPPSAPVGVDEPSLMARLDAIHRQVFGKPYPAPVGVVGFVVRHYTEDEGPTIKGNGFDGLRIGEDRDEAEEFIHWVNAALAQQPATDTDPAPCPVCLGFCGDSGATCSERMEVRE